MLRKGRIIFWSLIFGAASVLGGGLKVAPKATTTGTENTNNAVTVSSLTVTNSSTLNGPVTINGNNYSVGIGRTALSTAPLIISTAGAAAAFMLFQNSNTGASVSDGLRVGIGSGGAGSIYSL